MGGGEQFAIGAEVAGTDGVCGVLTRVVIDPLAKAVTHLVVEARHGDAGERLVPVDLVAGTDAGIQLRCRRDEFAKLESAREEEYLPGAAEDYGYATGQSWVMPYFPLLAGSGMGMGMGMGLGMPGTALGAGMGLPPEMAGVPGSASGYARTEEKVPLGDVEVHRGDAVLATDGPIGRVEGLVVDPTDHHVTHILLQEGHLWGKKQVAIGIKSVISIQDGVRLSLSKADVEHLPPVNVGGRG